MNTLFSISKARKGIESHKIRCNWGRGVKTYALEILKSMEDGFLNHNNDEWRLQDPEPLERATKQALNGARDWHEYSEGGCSLIYDGEIAERLCNPAELIETDHGRISPNKNEDWIACQARALHQAWELCKEYGVI